MNNLFAAAFDKSLILIIIVLVLLPVVGMLIKSITNRKMYTDLENNEETLKREMLAYGASATIKATFAKGDPNFKYDHEYQFFAAENMIAVKELESGAEIFIEYAAIEKFKLTEVKEKVMSNPAYGGSRLVDNSKFMIDMIYTAADSRRWNPLFCINSHQEQVNFNDYMTAECDIFKVVANKLKQTELTEK